ncbi:MAG: hypothetical protein AAFQ82_26785 [Myxococcota bacterium]
MSASLDDQSFEHRIFNNKAELVEARPELYEQIRYCVYYEAEEGMRQVAENFSVRVIDGDLNVAHPEDYEGSTFDRVLDAMGMKDWQETFLVFTGNLTLERSLGLGDRYERVVVCGDFSAGGVVNDWGTLFVLGETRISGVLYFCSDNGGFTGLRLAEPVHLIATQSNLFDVRLRSKYFFDPIFSGFEGESNSVHDENIRAAFDGTARVVSIEELASHFGQYDESVGEEIRSGQHYKWITQVALFGDPRKFIGKFELPATK